MIPYPGPGPAVPLTLPSPRRAGRGGRRGASCRLDSGARTLLQWVLRPWHCLPVNGLLIVWTRHAEERQQEWQRKLGITRHEVEEIVKNPEQVVPGDRAVLVAQARREGGLLRVPFVEGEAQRKILTVYWTSRVERYWKGDVS